MIIIITIIIRIYVYLYFAWYDDAYSVTLATVWTSNLVLFDM